MMSMRKTSENPTADNIAIGWTRGRRSEERGGNTEQTEWARSVVCSCSQEEEETSTTWPRAALGAK
jgi:hypothetical protein